MFTINLVDVPGSLRRCLATTNLIDSTDTGLRQRPRRVTNWQHGTMAARWATAGFVETEKDCRFVMATNSSGYSRPPWINPSNSTALPTNAKPDNAFPP
jgi:hypothetical protein